MGRRRRRKGGRIQKAKGANTEEKEKGNRGKNECAAKPPRSGSSPQGPAERPRKVQPSPSAEGAPGSAGLSEVGGAGRRGANFLKCFFVSKKLTIFNRVSKSENLIKNQ